MRRQSTAWQPSAEVSRQLDGTAFDIVTSVSNNMPNISTVAVLAPDLAVIADNIDSIMAVIGSLGGGGSVSVGGGQFLGSASIKGIQYMAQSTSEILTIAANTNAFSVASFTINNGGTINVSDNSTYKIL